MSLKYFFVHAVFRPLEIIALFIFRQLLVPMYRVYLVLKKTLTRVFAPAKNKIIYPLLHKSTIHIIIIAIALAVIVNNLYVKDTRAEEFGQQSILSSLTSTDSEATITETALQNTRPVSQSNTLAGVLSVKSKTDSSATSQIVTSESSGAVVKPELSSTSIGERPREQVEYYIVQGGDTISTIAEKFGISTNTILWENKLGPRDYIKPGDKLTILPQSGLSHQIKKGDSIDSIAKKYGVSADNIITYNKLADASAIEQSEILIIPGGTMPEEVKPQTRSSSSSKLGILDIIDVPPPSRVSSSARLLWPGISHRINQYYRGGRHTGIDIDGDTGNPIYAADDGRVEYASADRSGYGLHVVINHGGGIKTLYGHASKLYVKVGDSVKRGQTIAAMGCTGRCTGTHIHFEVRVNGKFVNPLTYL